MSALGNFFRRRYDRLVNKAILDRLETQSQLQFDAHWRDLLNSTPYANPLRLERYGFRTYSQNDEDGIIQEIFSRIGSSASTFVEFGVEDGRESNSALLLLKGWRGLWIECDERQCERIKRHFAVQIASGQLQISRAFVNRDNIESLISLAGLRDIDCISIDVDGNDYWIWKAMTSRPRLVIIEYNAKFRPPLKWVMSYNEHHRWDGSDYHGASLQSLADLGREKGYTLVGCNLAGVNAFFVRDDLVADKFATLSVTDLYNPPRYYAGQFMLRGHQRMGRGSFETI
jgi:hypothetical protein